MPLWQRILETVVFVPVCFYGIHLSWPFLEWPSSPEPPQEENGCGNKIKQSPLIIQLEQYKPQLLRCYSVVFCVELIYKILSRTGIYVLNPCHICTMLQLTLLSMDKNDPRVTQLFRFQMYVMPGALFALAFPILNTRLVSCWEIYFEIILCPTIKMSIFRIHEFRITSLLWGNFWLLWLRD